MRTLLLLFALSISFTFSAIPAAAQDHLELFGGYSYLRPSVPVVVALGCPAPICSGITSTYYPNLNGWELAATYKPHSVIGLTADVSGQYGTLLGNSLHMQTYLFGPQFSFPSSVSPFAHVLIGAAHETFSSASANAFAVAFGAGINIKLAPHVAFRPLQIDYLLTRFGPSTQNQPHVSAGLVFHF
jgi:hypothetical protein